MRRNHGQLQISAFRQAFTLVELMVVGAIIVMLMALTLFTMSMVAHSTKVAKTRATIQKIDTAMQNIFASRENSFITIKSKVAINYSNLTEEERQKIAAHFIWDTMRMEMPQSWAEVYDSTNPANKLGPITITGTSYSVVESPLLDYYWQAYNNAPSTNKPSRAALLFLIIQNLDPESLESFHGSEIADVDGFLVFVDAWGNPIQFLRWAPAFSDSDLQQNVLKMAGFTPQSNQSANEQWWKDRGTQLREQMELASKNHPDPMDERTDSIGWFLYPLIYSAGPDGKYGIAVETIDSNGMPVSPKVGPDGILDPFIDPYGMPYGSEHFDNIHNHRWYRSF